MNRFQTTGLGQDDFAEMVAEDVERALAHYDEAINQATVVSVGKIAGSIASAVTSLSPRHQRAIDTIHADLPGLAQKFVRALAAEAARRSEAGAAGLPVPLSAGAPPPPQPDDLESMLIEDWAGRVAGSTYLEESLRIARSTLHRWQRRGDVIALRKGGRKHVFPLAQFVDGRPVAGISDVLKLIGNPRLAWLWLTRPAAQLDGRIPIDLLRADQVDEVVEAARMFAPG
ncbi:MbcA/ParS/Xre antitoxin family protein [Mesorhizobium sp. B283B1A]|uniref:antitoxin Xre/MbcA/ParS-like domain-containing protein n=1 Tax=Mesorhizobium TaxID=68287 RepID=UPI001CD17BDE|nr:MULTISPECIES: antitoxin Xre/MbcA/ParS toxin-binding domain-containing protein [Mesorhizobium]MCA0049801.1 MbcA/ParS/Xre antitoxin family protein [Mesorhizobium sp. B283B1A]UQS64975.1 MbcA/ParS/Xre antitoxin family protein [Mesorhizobium opportunistum]